MLRKTDELRFWTPPDVLEVLRVALELVADLEPPDDLRSAAFSEAVRLLGNKHVVMEQVQLGASAMAIPRGA